MTVTHEALLGAVARRLEQDPDHVLATLRLVGGLDALPGPDDPHAVDLARTLNAQRLTDRRRDFRARALTTQQLCAILGGVSRQAVADRVRSGNLLRLEISGRSYFPDWQLGPDGPVAGLARMLTALRAAGRGPLAADALMRTPLPEAGGRRPAALLAAGEIEPALHYIRTAGT